MSSVLYSLLIIILQMINDLGITNGDESKVGYYVGIMVKLINVNKLTSL